jgi:hypothetical protein
MEMLLDSGSAFADSRGVTLDGFLYLHKLMIQGGRQECVWCSLLAHGYAPAPSLHLLPSSIPLLAHAPSSHLLFNSLPSATWGPSHTAWRFGGSHRAALTPHAAHFLSAFFAAEEQLSEDRSCNMDLDQDGDVCSALSALLEVIENPFHFLRQRILSMTLSA